MRARDQDSFSKGWLEGFLLQQFSSSPELSADKVAFCQFGQAGALSDGSLSLKPGELLSIYSMEQPIV
jgi:hypothetical protein